MARAVGISVGLVCAALVPCQAAATASRSTGTMPAVMADGAHAVVLGGRAATPPRAVLETDPGRDLSSGAEYDETPDVSGTRVAWWRHPDRITIRDLATGETQERVPPVGATNLNPSIDGDHVVFARLPSSGDWQILVYDIATGTEQQIGTFPRDYGCGRLRISGDRIVWHAPRPDGNWDIYLYDLASRTGRWLTSDPADDADPDVDGHFVTWIRRSASGSWWDVWLHDLDTGSETLLAGGTAGRAPRISGDRVVWGDIRSSGLTFSLYEYSLTTGTTRRVPTQTEMENSLTLDGHRMAWVNRCDDPNRPFYDDIFVYDFDTASETRLTQLPVRQWFPELSGDRLVWLDERSGTSHVYLYDFLTNRYRLYSDVTKEHLYTTDSNEYQVLGTRGWLQEGIAHRVYTSLNPVSGVTPVPLFRLYHAGIRQHLWTKDRNEYDVLPSRGWTQEGLDGFVLPSEVAGVTVPLYRLAYGDRDLPLHLWTTDLNEYTVLATRGWLQEGVAAHVVP